MTVSTTRLIMLDFLDGLEADRSTLSERERVMLRRSTTSSHFDLTYGLMSQPLKTVTTPAAFLGKFWLLSRHKMRFTEIDHTV